MGFNACIGRDSMKNVDIMRFAEPNFQGLVLGLTPWKSNRRTQEGAEQ